MVSKRTCILIIMASIMIFVINNAGQVVSLNFVLHASLALVDQSPWSFATNICHAIYIYLYIYIFLLWERELRSMMIMMMINYIYMSGAGSCLIYMIHIWWRESMDFSITMTWLHQYFLSSFRPQIKISMKKEKREVVVINLEIIK